MSQATIETRGSVEDNLCEVIVEDSEGRDVVFLNNVEAEEALAEGPRVFLDLLGRYLTPYGIDILQAAYINETEVTLNGAVVAPQDLVDGIGIAPTPKTT